VFLRQAGKRRTRSPSASHSLIEDAAPEPIPLAHSLSTAIRGEPSLFLRQWQLGRCPLGNHRTGAAALPCPTSAVLAPFPSPCSPRQPQQQLKASQAQLVVPCRSAARPPSCATVPWRVGDQRVPVLGEARPASWAEACVPAGSAPARSPAPSGADTLQCRARAGLPVRFHLLLFSCHYFKAELQNS